MIPALAFGNAKASPTSDYIAAGEAASLSFPDINEFAPFSKEKPFSSKACRVDINNLLLTAVSRTSIINQRFDSLGNDVWIPLVGSMTYETREATYSTFGGGSAFFASHGKRDMKASIGSAVCIRLDPVRLEATCLAVSGSQRLALTSDHSRLLSLDSKEFSVSGVLNSLFQLIDGVNCDPVILERLGVDDFFYRLCVMLLHSNIVIGNAHEVRSTHVRRELVRLCEYLRENLTRPVSLTKMEQMSGLSARALQYSFQSAFGMRPKEWIRRERLHAARRLLMRPEEGGNVTTIAYDFCFPSPTDFSRHYRALFGELPSMTLSQKRLGRLI